MSEEWSKLWDLAKDLEKRIEEEKRKAYIEIKNRFPDIKYKSFGNVVNACLKGRLREDVMFPVEEFKKEIDRLHTQAQEFRRKSEQLLELERKLDNRRQLDPKIDIVPTGHYKKLKDCKIYPLRQQCNYGENSESKWERCEYMKYDNTKNIMDPERWICIAPDES
jgi:hypothetical protein